MNTDKTQWSCHIFIYWSYLSYDTYSASHSQVTLGLVLHTCSERSLSDMGCDTIYTDSCYMATLLPYTQISVQYCLQLGHKGSVVRGSNPGVGKIFRTLPDRPSGRLNLLQIRYRVIPRGKAAGAWRKPPIPTLELRLKKEWNCTSSPPVGLHGLL